MTAGAGPPRAGARRCVSCHSSFQTTLQTSVWPRPTRTGLGGGGAAVHQGHGAGRPASAASDGDACLSRPRPCLLPSGGSSPAWGPLRNARLVIQTPAHLLLNRMINTKLSNAHCVLNANFRRGSLRGAEEGGAVTGRRGVAGGRGRAEGGVARPRAGRGQQARTAGPSLPGSARSERRRRVPAAQPWDRGPRVPGRGRQKKPTAFKARARRVSLGREPPEHLRVCVGATRTAFYSRKNGKPPGRALSGKRLNVSPVHAAVV